MPVLSHKKGEVREPMSVFRDSLRKPASRITLLLVTAGLLTYPIYCAFPTMKSVAMNAINTHLLRDLQQQVLFRIHTGFPLIQTFVEARKPLTGRKISTKKSILQKLSRFFLQILMPHHRITAKPKTVNRKT